MPKAELRNIYHAKQESQRFCNEFYLSETRCIYSFQILLVEKLIREAIRKSKKTTSKTIIEKYLIYRCNSYSAFFKGKSSVAFSEFIK